MKKLNIIILLSALVVLSIAFSSYVFVNQPKVAFVHVQDVYNEFDYKKELENKFETIKTARIRILDSLEIQINVLAKNIQNSEVNKEMNMQNYQYLVAQYQNKQQVFTEDNQAVSEQYTEQIWNQLNQYIEEFGKENNYDFIHGADGSGSVMHANQGYNITDELKNFVNERYQGGKMNEK